MINVCPKTCLGFKRNLNECVEWLKINITTKLFFCPIKERVFLLDRIQTWFLCYMTSHPAMRRMFSIIILSHCSWDWSLKTCHNLGTMLQFGHMWHVSSVEMLRWSSDSQLVQYLDQLSVTVQLQLSRLRAVGELGSLCPLCTICQWQDIPGCCLKLPSLLRGPVASDHVCLSPAPGPVRPQPRPVAASGAVTAACAQPAQRQLRVMWCAGPARPGWPLQLDSDPGQERTLCGPQSQHSEQTHTWQHWAWHHHPVSPLSGEWSECVSVVRLTVWCVDSETV